MPAVRPTCVQRRPDPSREIRLPKPGEGSKTEGRWVGGAIDLVVRLFALLLLLSTATGPEVGPLVGRLTKKHEDGKLGASLDEYFPPGSSAVVVVLDHRHRDRIGEALVNADKSFGRAIEPED